MSKHLFPQPVVILAIAGLLVVGVAQAAAAQAPVICGGQLATIVGTAGDDVLQGTSGPDVIVTRQGNDVIHGFGGDDVICAGKGDDVIFGGPGFDIIFGAQGDDEIYAASGSDAFAREDSRGARMFGGAGNDIIYGSNRWDRMQGGNGEDILLGFEGRDWMRGGANDDTVDGGPGIDDLHGGSGNDVIELTDGDSVRGGAGVDECNISVGETSLERSCELPTTPDEVNEPSPGVVVISACNARDEFVRIENIGGTPISLDGWVLHDEGMNFQLELSELTLPPLGQVVIDSGAGSTDGPDQIRWNGQNVWNNDGDTATLLAPDGSSVQRRC